MFSVWFGSFSFWLYFVRRSVSNPFGCIRPSVGFRFGFGSVRFSPAHLDRFSCFLVSALRSFRGLGAWGGGGCLLSRERVIRLTICFPCVPNSLWALFLSSCFLCFPPYWRFRSLPLIACFPLRATNDAFRSRSRCLAHAAPTRTASELRTANQKHAITASKVQAREGKRKY